MAATAGENVQVRVGQRKRLDIIETADRLGISMISALVRVAIKLGIPRLLELKDAHRLASKETGILKGGR